MTRMSTGEEWAPIGSFGACIGVVVESFAFSCPVKPLSALGSDVLYPRIRVSCERFPVHVRDDDGYPQDGARGRVAGLTAGASRRPSRKAARR